MLLDVFRDKLNIKYKYEEFDNNSINNLDEKKDKSFDDDINGKEVRLYLKKSHILGIINRRKMKIMDNH